MESSSSQITVETLKFITGDRQSKLEDKWILSRWFGEQVLFRELKTCQRWRGMNKITISEMCWDVWKTRVYKTRLQVEIIWLNCLHPLSVLKIDL